MKDIWIAAALFIGFGWYVGLCITGGFFLGRWIGQQLGFETFLSLLGLGVGISFAAYGTYTGYSLLNKSSVEEGEQ